MNLDENKSTALKNTVQKYNNKKTTVNHKLFTYQQIQNRIYVLKDFIQKQSSDNHFSRLNLKFQRLRGYDNNRG